MCSSLLKSISMLSRTQNSSAGEKNLSFHQIFIFFLFYYEIRANHLTDKNFGATKRVKGLFCWQEACQSLTLVSTEEDGYCEC
jgi:hypothetical protein